MKNIKIGGSLTASAISLGCMRMSSLGLKDAEKLIGAALDSGINHFDHADIYGKGESEALFGRVLKANPDWRKKMVIQTKCGIVPGKMFDWSFEHIIESVDNSLNRLGLDRMDMLLLHRPDTLFEPQEVANAFVDLIKTGKVKHFGVSNCNAMQIELLSQPLCDNGIRLIANQLQLSAANTGMIDCGFNVNMTNAPSVNHDGSLLEYCRLKNITIQAWSPFIYGFFEGVFIDSPLHEPLNVCLKTVGEAHGISPSATALAFLLRHPAGIQPIVGTTNPTRLADLATAANITLTRQEWYAIYLSAGNKLP